MTAAASGPHPLEPLFHPRSVAIAGVSSKPKAWGSGDSFLRSLRRVNFAGQIYPVNPKITESNGLPCYPDLRSIPGPLDYVISAVPAPAVPQLLEDAIARGVPYVHLFTSGFGETGDTDRAELAQRILARAREAGVRLLGPNCMGVYCPETGLAFQEVAPRRPGDVGILSQSGGNAEELLNAVARRGLRFSKVISYGNALDLNEADFLDYLAHDDKTATISVYIEGPRAGRRFFEVMREAARRKPVAVLKSALTESGSRAAASHTGSLAGAEPVWRAFSRQAGFVLVDTIEQLEDMTVALRLLPPPAAPGAVYVGSGGGGGVLAADAAARAGLAMPRLTEATRARLASVTPIAGASVQNPVDTPNGLFGDPADLVETIAAAASDPQVGVVLYHAWLLDLDTGRHVEELGARIQGVMSEVRKRTSKALALSLNAPSEPDELGQAIDLTARLAEIGIPVFPSVYRAVDALSRWIRYYEARAVR